MRSSQAPRRSRTGEAQGCVWPPHALEEAVLALALQALGLPRAFRHHLQGLARRLGRADFIRRRIAAGWKVKLERQICARTEMKIVSTLRRCGGF